MKAKLERPWLTGSGVEISTIELKKICGGWDLVTWEAYLKWYESGRREAIVSSLTYLEICEEQVETIFESLAKSETPAKRKLVKRLLSNLPEREAEVLRAIYLEGRLQSAIAADLRISRSRIAHLKSAALAGLKWGLAGDKLTARRFMRGVSDASFDIDPSIWNQPMVPPPDEIEVCDSDDFVEQIDRLKNQKVRVAVLKLPTGARHIALLRFWHSETLCRISRKLMMGMNSVDQVCDASATKIKQTLIQFHTGTKL